MARSFNGSEQILLGSAGSAALNPAAITFCIWAYPTSLPNAYNATISRSVGFWQILVTAAGKIAIYIRTAGTTFYDGSGSHTLTTGNWYHLAGSYDSSAGLTGYVNGASDGTAAANGNCFTANGTTGLGYDPGSGGRLWNGRLADAAVWNIKLTTTEIAGLAFGMRPWMVRASNLIGYWPLTGRIPNYEPDSTPYANNGTLTGTSFAPDPPFLQTGINPMLKDMIMFLPPSPPSILFGQNIAAHYNWQIAPMEY